MAETESKQRKGVSFKENLEEIEGDNSDGLKKGLEAIDKKTCSMSERPSSLRGSGMNDNASVGGDSIFSGMTSRGMFSLTDAMTDDSADDFDKGMAFLLNNTLLPNDSKDYSSKYSFENVSKKDSKSLIAGFKKMENMDDDNHYSTDTSNQSELEKGLNILDSGSSVETRVKRDDNQSIGGETSFTGVSAISRLKNTVRKVSSNFKLAQSSVFGESDTSVDSDNESETVFERDDNNAKLLHKSLLKADEQFREASVDFPEKEDESDLESADSIFNLRLFSWQKSQNQVPVKTTTSSHGSIKSSTKNARNDTIGKSDGSTYASTTITANSKGSNSVGNSDSNINDDDSTNKSGGMGTTTGTHGSIKPSTKNARKDTTDGSTYASTTTTTNSKGSNNVGTGDSNINDDNSTNKSGWMGLVISMGFLPAKTANTSSPTSGDGSSKDNTMGKSTQSLSGKSTQSLSGKSTQSLSSMVSFLVEHDSGYSSPIDYEPNGNAGALIKDEGSESTISEIERPSLLHSEEEIHDECDENIPPKKKYCRCFSHLFSKDSNISRWGCFSSSRQLL